MGVLEPHYRRIPAADLPPIRRNPIHVVLDNLRSAFNVGSIFRTADAGAVEHLHLCGATACPPNLKLAKTALGAFDYVPWTYYERVIDAIERLRTNNVPLVGVETAAGAVSYADFEWPRPVAVVFGNEVVGLPEEVLGGCNHVVRIPMRGYKNTINVATAFGIVLFEVIRRWESASIDTAGP